MRSCLLATALLLLWLSSAAQAAEPAPAPPPAPISTDELDRLVHTLQDDTARARLVEDLRALIAAQRGAMKEKSPATAAFGELSQQIDALSGEILAGVTIVIDAPRLAEWAHEQISNAASRHLWSEAALKFGLIFGLAAIAELIIRSIISRLLPHFPVRRSDTRLIRAIFGLLGLILNLLPVLVFAGTAYSVLSLTLTPFSRTWITLSTLVNATVRVRLLLCVVRSVLLPADAGAVFVPLDAETRNYFYIWIRRFTFGPFLVTRYQRPRGGWAFPERFTH